MLVSIIIPVYNEEVSIPFLIHHLRKYRDKRLAEIIVVDGGSTDQTVQVVRDMNVTCLLSPAKGRAVQMNYGASIANGSVFYFIHADSFPPPTYLHDISIALKQGFESGCYRFRFNSDRVMLKLNSWFTRFDRIMCRGGDQTLFITRRLFNQLGGYRNNFLIMEDYDLIKKIRQTTPFKIIPKDVIVSARKYDHNSYLQVNFANFVIFMMYFAGACQQTMVHAYKNLIDHPKF